MRTLLIGGMIWFAMAGYGPVEAASEMTADDLSNICAGNDHENEAGCKFFVLGIAEATSLGKKPDGAKGWQCIPAAVSSGEMVGLVKTTFKRDFAVYPEDRKLPAVSFVLGVLANKYPCKP